MEELYKLGTYESLLPNAGSLDALARQMKEQRPPKHCACDDHKVTVSRKSPPPRSPPLLAFSWGIETVRIRISVLREV